VLLGLVPLVPLPVRNLGREDHQVARRHLVAPEPDLDVERAPEHEVELVEFVHVQRRPLLPRRDLREIDGGVGRAPGPVDEPVEPEVPAGELGRVSLPDKRALDGGVPQVGRFHEALEREDAGRDDLDVDLVGVAVVPVVVRQAGRYEHGGPRRCHLRLLAEFDAQLALHHEVGLVARVPVPGRPGHPGRHLGRDDQAAFPRVQVLALVTAVQGHVRMVPVDCPYEFHVLASLRLRRRPSGSVRAAAGGDETIVSSPGIAGNTSIV
jgi:hypothetical protein